MKFTLSWLREHLETTATVAEIRDRLTTLGLEVEGVEDRAAKLSKFVVGYVVEAVQHPNADKLRVCTVDTGSGVVQVVCGAPNARTGMKGIFAPSGTHVPGTGLDLKPTKIRGVDSNGMLCSARELQISDDHEGIIDLPADTPVGVPAAQALGLDDPTIEIKATPNRADCLGVRGIARDLAASGLGKLKEPRSLSALAGTYDSPIRWTHGYEAKPDSPCPMVVGRHFRGVKNGPSPEWLQRRLRDIGLRPISALVDITNFVTFDLNRPLHVFDAAKLAGDLTMRQARDGETVLALDGATYALDPGMAVIADANGVHGIGGVMGGEHTGVSETTTEVFLEVAYFDPVSVAATGRKLGLQSDARYRFERGLDPESLTWGADVAARLILEICGGEASRCVSSGVPPTWARSYPLRPDRVKTLAGFDVPAAEQTRILSALGFDVQGAGPWIVSPPSWRGDVVGEADLVEEVARVVGYDSIPATSMPRVDALSRPVRTPEQRRVPIARRALASRGMVECVTWSFMPGPLAKTFGGGAPDLKLLNPISAELTDMRPTAIPNLLQAAVRNESRGYRDCALFEVGPAYRDPTPAGQRSAAAGVRTGMAAPRAWNVAQRPVDAFDAKADALAALAAIGAPVDNLATFADGPDWMHPGRRGSLKLGDRTLAIFGEVHPEISADLGLRGTAVAFEAYLDAAPPAKAKAGKARAPLKLAAFQPVERDFAFVVDADVAAEKLVRAARSAEKKLLADVRVFDLYAGKGLPEGKKSIALAVVLQPVERTLTDAEIDAVGAQIVAAVAKATGATLRG